MNKTIRNLAIAALFIFPGLSGFPQEVQQDETPAAKPVVEENVNFIPGFADYHTERRIANPMMRQQTP